MRIVFIADKGEKYGASKSLVEMIKTLKNRYGINPVVLTYEKSNINRICEKENIENYAIEHGQFMVSMGGTPFRSAIKFILLPYYYFKYYTRNRKAKKIAKRLIDFDSVDIIHSNVNRNDIGAILAKEFNVPHVWHIREFGDKDYRCIPLRLNYIKFMNSSTSRFISISNAIRTAWNKKGLSKEKNIVIYNGIDTSKFNIHNDSEGEKKLKIIFTGSISPSKGQAQLIKAVGTMHDDIKRNIKVDIYGTGNKEYLLYLKYLVKKYNLKKQVNFKGYSNNISSILGKYDVGIICSKSEGFGRVTVEYMAAKLCVVASDTGANPELVTDGVTGYLYKFGDIKDLHNKLLFLYNNKKVIKEIGERSYKAVENRFTTERNANEIYKVYKSIKEV